MTEAERTQAAAAAKAMAVALEELAFMPVDQVAAPDKLALERPLKWAKVEASGGDGTVRSLAVVMPESLLVQVATTVLGVEERDIGPAVLRDTVAEIANMACGGLMRTLAGPHAFSLGLPIVGDGDDIAGLGTEGFVREQLEVNGIRMDMVIQWT